MVVAEDPTKRVEPLGVLQPSDSVDEHRMSSDSCGQRGSENFSLAFDVRVDASSVPA